MKQSELQYQISAVLTSIAVGYICEQRYGSRNTIDELWDDLQHIYSLTNPGHSLRKVANAMVDKAHGVDNPSRIDTNTVQL